MNEQEIIDYAEILNELNSRWTPHEKQIEIGYEILYAGKKNVFVCAGRNLGKTDVAAYLLWRWAMTHPKTENYVFEPYLKQAREILWVSRRIQNFGPAEWIESMNETEMRITFVNGSFIKLEGSDNVAAMAGIKPRGLIIYDEFKDHRLESITNFEPNRAAFDVPALFIGTPPISHNHFVDYMELSKKSDEWSFITAPTRANPHISQKWLENKKKELELLGDMETWYREYEALYVIGGKRSIFPSFLKLTHGPFNQPIDVNKWHLIIAHDPAATSVFAVSFMLFNSYSKRFIIFDEIYETNHDLMTSRKIYAAVNEKIQDIRKLVRGVSFIYDEAAAYFKSEVHQIDDCNWFLEPTQKHLFGVDGYITLVRECLNRGLIEVTENCVKTIWEFQNYIKNDKGIIPKENDHLINAVQYGVASTGINFDAEAEPKQKDVEDMRRGYSLDEELDTGYRELL